MKGSGSDYIKIEDLALPTFPTSKSRTLSDETLPLSVLLEIFHDCTHAARLDDLEYSINYASLSDSILNMFKTRDLHHVDHLEAITDMIFEHCFHQVDLQELSVQIQEPLQNAPLHSTTYKSRRSPRSHVYFEAFTVNQLKTNAIIGIHPEERVNKQSVLVDITIERNQRSKSSFDYEELVRRVLEVLQSIILSAFALTA
jgi:dihydroneopterin aldolase/2-amino-4-hydroxy-6-hydroxymethyldihydropteridine diphosphokinase/dihydropteroate synthase